MRPVSSQFPINQPFGSMATQGVAPSWTPDTVGWYVRMYGNYQPFGHAGCDIACPEGTPVYAMASGTVLWADWGTKLPGDDSWGPNGYFRRWALYKGFPGIVTVIQHPGWVGVYAHLSDAPLNPGDKVAEGQRIATSGSTGGVAPHLHVEALVDLNYPTGNGLIYGRTNPEPYFGGIAAMGEQITPLSEEDDMPLNDDDIRRIADAVHTRAAKRPNGGINTLEWSLGAESERTEGIIARTAEATARLILGTKFKRQGDGQSGDTDLGSVIAWSDSNFTHAGTANLGASAGLDPEQVNAAIKSGLDAALAGTQATITLGKP